MLNKISDCISSVGIWYYKNMGKTPTQENLSVIFAKATPEDIPVLLEIEESVSGVSTYSPMLDADEWVEEIQKENVYLIKKDGIVVGNISYERSGDSHVYISGLVISPAFQGQGIARESLKKLLNDLGGIQKIDLVTHPENHKALELYQSLGFVIESRKEDYYGDGEPRLVLSLENTKEMR